MSFFEKTSEGCWPLSLGGAGAPRSHYSFAT
jgi:hypothetical protein